MDVPKCDPVLLPFAGYALDRCDDRQLEAFAERAALLEFEAGVKPRALAEALAFLELLHQSPQLLTGLIVQEVELDGATEWLLTTNLTYARLHLANIGGVEIAVRDPADVIQMQYGGMALLGTLG